MIMMVDYSPVCVEVDAAEGAAGRLFGVVTIDVSIAGFLGYLTAESW